jgi:serine O-acetyltransferase
MIKNKGDLKYYLECDEYARFGSKVSFLKKARLGKMWWFNVYLRKAAYYTNLKRSFFNILFELAYRYKLKKMSMQLGWSIAPNTFGPGLCIVHIGPVIVNHDAKVGANCRIHVGVNIGANGGQNDAPELGDNVYIGPGAKLFGKIKIGNDCVIGANAVVNKSFEQNGVTIGGIPAKVISCKDSTRFINRLPVFEE